MFSISDMNQDLTVRTIWSKAGIAGAVIGTASGAFIFIRQAASGLGSPVAEASLSFLLWLIKFAGCIWLMKMFMKKLCKDYPGATNSGTFKFGMATALYSALIYSALYLADILFIAPDMFESQMAAAIQSYSSILDSNSMAMLEKMEGSYPQISFFSNLVYCFLYGTVLSAILSRNIPSRDPFSNMYK